jgi:hypothetical protein
MMMQESTTSLAVTLAILAQQARKLGLTDTEWSARAGVRKETLSRLRRRDTCDFATLRVLADVVGASLGVLGFQTPNRTSDGHFPACVSRDYENRLVTLAASAKLDSETWAAFGPHFFMAGLAVMLASRPNADRRGLLLLAERLHPGIGEPAVFSLWLDRSPVRPSRFLPLLEAVARHAA